MKKFKFALRRVMDLRCMQARLEEAKLEGLYAELRATDAHEAELIAQKSQQENALRKAKAITGFDLELFGTFRAATAMELERIQKAREDCRKRITSQSAVLMKKRREVKLLETLQEKRLGQWEKEMLKEVDREAEEAYLAKWRPEH